MKRSVIIFIIIATVVVFAFPAMAWARPDADNYLATSAGVSSRLVQLEQQVSLLRSRLDQTEQRLARLDGIKAVGEIVAVSQAVPTSITKTAWSPHLPVR